MKNALHHVRNAISFVVREPAVDKIVRHQQEIAEVAERNGQIIKSTAKRELKKSSRKLYAEASRISALRSVAVFDEDTHKSLNDVMKHLVNSAAAVGSHA